MPTVPSPSGTCAGCGAPIALDADRHVVACSHCGAANLVVGGVTLPVARLRPIVGDRDVDATIRRYALARDLASAPEVLSVEESWVPYWVPCASVVGGVARAAVEVEDPLLGEIPIPTGDLEPLDAVLAEADASWPWPDVPPSGGETLRYVPYYRLRLRAGGAETPAYLDRTRGEVLASAPLNPERLRLGAALGGLLAAYGLVTAAIGALAPTPLSVVVLSAALSAAVAWPAARLAARPGTSRPTGGGRHR